MGLRGQAGELLVVLAVLASVTVIVSTTYLTQDVPNVQKSSLGSLKDIRDLLSRAILDWLNDGVVKDPIMCNGLYPVNETTLADTLGPYIERELLTTLEGGENIEVDAGILKEFDFEGLDGFTITLTDGSFIYDDSTIYAEDTFDKEYFFNVRLPLAVRIVQDWIRCDAGNMSMELARGFGEECFFGRKDERYPQGCILKPKKQFNVEEADRSYMLSKGITPARLADGVQGSLDVLNEYFAGNEYCKEQVVTDDTAITCTFELEDIDIFHEMLPWSSEKIAIIKDVPTTLVSYSQLLAMGDYLDFQKFVRDDSHVWSIPARIDTYPWKDDDLLCTPDGRENVAPSLNGDRTLEEADRVDMVKGEKPVFASPVMYVNVTRGAKFTVKIKCIDTQVALLGQPLEYTFTIRHGIRQHCGQDKMKNGDTMCSGCTAKPGLDTAECKTLALPTCATSVRVCTQAVIWMTAINATPPIYDWKGDWLSTLQGNPLLIEEVNATCGSVWGMEAQYPLPRDEEGKPLCPSAQAMVCCATPGYVEECIPPFSPDNPGCFMGQEEYMQLCSRDAGCGLSDCNTYTCNENTEYKCVDPQPIPGPCGDDSGCFQCEGGECTFQEDMIDVECRPKGADRSGCVEYTCQANDKGGGSCKWKPINKGESCTSPWVNPICGSPVCNDKGVCESEPNPANDGVTCKQPETRETPTERCTTTFKCAGGVCAAQSEECEPKEGPVSCPPECPIPSDGKCTC